MAMSAWSARRFVVIADSFFLAWPIYRFFPVPGSGSDPFHALSAH
jgi:hypothetical protein